MSRSFIRNSTDSAEVDFHRGVVSCNFPRSFPFVTVNTVHTLGCEIFALVMTKQLSAWNWFSLAAKSSPTDSANYGNSYVIFKRVHTWKKWLYHDKLSGDLKIKKNFSWLLHCVILINSHFRKKIILGTSFGKTADEAINSGVQL